MKTEKRMSLGEAFSIIPDPPLRKQPRNALQSDVIEAAIGSFA